MKLFRKESTNESKNQKKKYVKPVVITSIIVAVLVIGGVVAVNFAKGAVGGMSADGVDAGVEAMPLDEHDLSNSINVRGKVESQNVYVVTSDVSAKVKSLNVTEGDRVNAGDVLLTLDDSEIRGEISDLSSQSKKASQQAASQSQTAMVEAQGLANQAEADSYQVEVARNELAAAQAAYKEGKKKKDISDSELLTLKNAVSEAQGNLHSKEVESANAKAAAKNAVLQAQASNYSESDSLGEINKLNRQLNNMTIKAGQSGVVTKLNVSNGGMATEGALMQIEDDSALKVTVSIRETDILKLQEGMPAKITCEALGDKVIDGKVSKVINFASSQSVTDATSEGGDSSASSGSDYSATIDIDPGSGLLLGMNVKVEIITQESEIALSVPYDSIVKGDKEGEGYVFRAVESGKNSDDGSGLLQCKIEKVPVTIEKESGYYTAISSKDLKKGDLIITVPDWVNDKDETTVYVTDSSQDMEIDEDI